MLRTQLSRIYSDKSNLYPYVARPSIIPKATKYAIRYSFYRKAGRARTQWATVRRGQIELLESAELPKGVRVLVTVLPDNEAEFWLPASQTSLDAVWNNAEDDVYAQLLQT